MGTQGTEITDLTDEFQALIVKPLEIYDGEVGMVVLLKLRRKMEKVINQHNKLVKYLNEQKHPKKIERSFIGQQPPKKEKKSNDPRDVIDFLIQLRHYCECVAPWRCTLVVTAYSHPWCKDCNRPIIEKEEWTC